MHKRNITTILGGIAVAFAVSACGGEPLPQGMTEEELSLDPSSLIETCASAEFSAVEPEGIFESIAAAIGDPPYRKNPDVECRLVSKYNGDIDGGHDVSGGNYDNFKQCMTDAGCFTRGGTYTTKACDEKLKECQEHLIGAGPAADLEMTRKRGALTADDWRKFGKGL